MEALTFGEQVKIMLGRKGMTIKELAEHIEAQTGMKMSRQNLTQRLGRDNFQEQDMRMIANILDCPFQLSIIPLEAQPKKIVKPSLAIEIAESVTVSQDEGMNNRESILEEPLSSADLTDEIVETKAPGAEKQEAEIQEVEKQEAEIQEVKIREVEIREVETQTADEVDITIGDMYSIHEELSEMEELKENALINGDIQEIEAVVHQHVIKPFKTEKKSGKGKESTSPRKDETEDLKKGDINPYTGREYQTNSVRAHPNRIGYVQVYNRDEHKWTDMTEWAFLALEERKKNLLGKNYETPIYLD